jgi:GDPmannose 4,6-dehydratase
MGKKALITGIRGQDGGYLAKLLIDKGYEVIGADRRSGDSTLWRMKELGIEKNVKMLYIDLLELTNVMNMLDEIRPDEIYNLAAQSFVQASFQQPILTAEIDALGVLRILESVRTLKFQTRFYQASTSEMFGKVAETPQTENTKFHPRSPYGVAKLFAHWITINYRESYNMFACSGILFNHESPLRGIEFITRKITDSIARIKYGLQQKITVGNLDSKRDWGFAKEYVEAMWLMLQQEKPDDFVIATGETHTIRELIEEAFKYIGKEIIWSGKGIKEQGKDKSSGKVLVDISPEFFRPSEVELLIGNAQKAKNILGWQPKTKFKELVQMMVDADIKKVSEEIKK